MSNPRDGRSDSLMFVFSEIDDFDISIKAFRVYAHLVRRAGTNGECFPSYQSIGDCCFKVDYAKPDTRKTLAIRAVKELVELHLLTKTIRKGPDGNKSNDYELTSKPEWLEWIRTLKKEAKKAENVLSIKSGGVMGSHPRGDGGSPKGSPYSLTAKTAVPGCDRDFAIALDESDRPRSEAPRSRSTQGDKWVAGTATYPDDPDKQFALPVLNSDKSNYVQPTFTAFEFENSFTPEEGLVPLWGEEDGLEFVPIAQIGSNHSVNANKMDESNHIPDTSKMVETIAQPEPPTEEKQPHPELRDRIKKERRVPPPRPRKVSREAQLYAYRYDAAGWLQLPPANGINSQPRAIAVRALQELILQDYGGRGLAAEWEEDDDGFWRVLDHKSCGEDLTMEEALSKRGRLPLQELRNYAVAFAGLDQETFNQDLQRLYETALEYCREYGRQYMLEDGERWIDQPIFDDYLGAHLQSA
jgi:hypothetical protein